MDDLEVLRRLNFARSTLPLDVQMKGAEPAKARTREKEPVESEISDAELEEITQKLELFNQGHAVLLEEIEQKAKDGYFQAHAELESISIATLLEDDDSFELAIEELISSRFNYTVYLDEILEYDEAILLNLYQVAVQLYDEVQIEKAILAFIFLSSVHPGIGSFWKGLGLSHERNQNIVEAIRAYKMAVERSQDFSPYYDMIRCCEKSGDFSEVLDLLDKLKTNNLFPDEVENALAYIAQHKH